MRQPKALMLWKHVIVASNCIVLATVNEKFWSLIAPRSIPSVTLAVDLVLELVILQSLEHDICRIHERIVVGSLGGGRWVGCVTIVADCSSGGVPNRIAGATSSSRARA